MNQKISSNELNRIVQSDCIDFMRKMPSSSVDLIITDPPYGDNVTYGFNHKTIKNNENPLINCLALVECYRVLKRNKVLYNFTNWKHYPFLTEFILRYTKFNVKHVIVWQKNHFGVGWAFRHQFELILVLEKGEPKYELTNFSDVQKAKHITHDKQTHPHQKPIDLLEKMIIHSSKEGDIVFDPFCGSGSTCLAAQKKDRQWLGVEQEECYIKMAEKRLQEARANG